MGVRLRDEVNIDPSGQSLRIVPRHSHSDNESVRLVSHNGNTLKSLPRLCDGLASDLAGRRCVLDGEIVSLDTSGEPQFRDLLSRRAEPLFYAFDILWDEHAKSDDEEEMCRFRNGKGLRYLPLVDRKLRLRGVVTSAPNVSSTATTSMAMVKVRFGWCARTISKESGPSANPIHLLRSGRTVEDS